MTEKFRPSPLEIEVLQALHHLSHEWGVPFKRVADVVILLCSAVTEGHRGVDTLLAILPKETLDGMRTAMLARFNDDAPENP